MIAAEVECHSEYTYAERPRAFEWQGEHILVAALEAEWQTPESKHFVVRSDQNQLFELVYDFVRHTWQVFQQEKTTS